MTDLEVNEFGDWLLDVLFDLPVLPAGPTRVEATCGGVTYDASVGPSGPPAPSDDAAPRWSPHDSPDNAAPQRSPGPSDDGAQVRSPTGPSRSSRCGRAPLHRLIVRRRIGAPGASISR